jgi:ubiquinone/menaquinone biosynthesis C-methylase UbiE
MDFSSVVRTKGTSEKKISSDALSFYENYWTKGQEIDPENINNRRALLLQVFPCGLAGRRVVELGVGGEGGFLNLLQEHSETIGFDASASAIELCRKRGLDVRLCNLDAERLSLADSSIDAVFAMEVFEHFSSPQFVLEEVHRVLGPRGVAVISTPNPMVYHWPRLFYPELFQFDAFRDFLMANGFKINRTLASGTIPCKLLHGANKLWHWIWYCSKLDPDDARMLFEHGLHFWEQKDANGLRKKPIEAIEFFRRSCLLEPDVILYRFHFVRALVYRCINGESEEFKRQYEFLLNTVAHGSEQSKREALYHISMLYVEFEKLGIPYMEKAIFDEALRRLEQHPGSAPYVERILKSRISQG